MHSCQAGLAVLIIDKVGFKWKLVRLDKEEHCTLIRTIHCDVIILNIYVPNFRASDFIL